MKKSFLTTINVTVVSIVCITVLITSGLFLAYDYSKSQERAMQMLRQELEQLNQQVESYIGEMHTITSQLATDSQLGRSIDQFNSGNIQKSTEGKKSMDYIVQRTMQFDQMIDNVTIYTRKGVTQYNNYAMVSGNNVAALQEQTWFQKLMNEEITDVFEKNVVYSKPDEEETYFLWATKFKTTLYVDRKEEERMLVLTFRMKQLRELLDSIGRSKDINLSLEYLPDHSVLHRVVVNEKELGNDDREWTGETKRFIVMDHVNDTSGLRLVGLVEKECNCIW